MARGICVSEDRPRTGGAILRGRDLPGVAHALGRALGEAEARRPPEGGLLPARGREVVRPLRGARRHELRLHGGRQLRRQGLRTGPHELRLRRPDRRAGTPDAQVPRAAPPGRRAPRRGRIAAGRPRTRSRRSPSPSSRCASTRRSGTTCPSRSRRCSPGRSRPTGRTRPWCSTAPSSWAGSPASSSSRTCTTTRACSWTAGSSGRSTGGSAKARSTFRPPAARSRCSTSSSRAWATSTSRSR